MRISAWLILFGFVLVGALDHTRAAVALPEGRVTLYSERQPGCTIVIPAEPEPAENQAALLIQSILARASGRSLDRFPIVRESRAAPQSGLFVGATRRGGDFLTTAVPQMPFDSAVGVRVGEGVVIVRSERRASIVTAASWFLEKQLGVHWFMPGPLGESVPVRAALQLTPGDETVRPGFVSRDMSVVGGESQDWLARNRFEPRLDHAHNLSRIFSPEDLQHSPEMAPMVGGTRYLPAPGDQDWQPNFLSAAAVGHAADAAMRAFAADPKRASFSLSANDSVRFDNSPATLAAVAPLRYFRHRPDYSALFFRFTNAVAERVAKQYPDRFLSAYAYYWTENAPEFRIAANVVPFLTADRSQWSLPEFAAEDQKLIERWCKSGARLVGVYDYFYGAPFLVPRPTLYTVKATLPFHYRTGVRAFFAEAVPNWALDGPKPWLTAQLLWAPEQNPDALLETYYREFWAESAAPMRDFYELCDTTWRELPGPARWLRFYRDDDQATIFPSARRVALRRLLETAQRLARTKIIRDRVAFALAGFSVSEAYGKFSDARDQLSRAVRGTLDPDRCVELWKNSRRNQADFLQQYAEIQREFPLAIAPQNLDVYLRQQPDSQAARSLLRTAGGKARLRQSSELTTASLGVSADDLERVLKAGRDVLQDAEWRETTIRPVDTASALEWTGPDEPWNGRGEPWEGRKVELDSSAPGPRTLRFTNCRTEGIGQWAPATPNAVYAARVKVRAQSSPGTATFLIVSFLDEQQRHIGLGTMDRLPAERSTQETELVVIKKAPPNARFIGLGLRVLNQIPGDFAEFSAASLRTLAPPDSPNENR